MQQVFNLPAVVLITGDSKDDFTLMKHKCSVAGRAIVNQPNPFINTVKKLATYGLVRRLRTANPVHLLRDGRAQSTEEAVLWHRGEGCLAMEAFRLADNDTRDA